MLALSYFPAKVLEIIDSYDILYTNSIKNKTEGNVINDVISYMYKNFLEETIKLDPILFHLFVRYLEKVRNASIFDCPL